MVDPRPNRVPLVSAGQIEHHVSDLTVTASAELTLQQLQDSLAAHDQWLPIDGDPSLPLGALVEGNSTGPLRLGFGAWRDLLLGMQFSTASGSLITAGGRTMKNVAGYDLTKFMVGQYGLFGKIVTITTRTYRRPGAALLVRLEASAALPGELLPSGWRPQWMMLADGAMWCGYLGDERTIAYHEAAMRRRPAAEVRRQSLDQDIAFRATRWLPDRLPVRYRLSLPPIRVLEFIQQLELRQCAADPTFGLIVGSCPTDRKAALRSAAATIGGSVVFDDAEDRRTFFGAGGAELELLKRLQSAFNA